MFADINVWKQHHESKTGGMCLGRILGVNEEAQGQGRVCKDKHVKKQWSGSKAFRVTEKQSSDDFSYLTSLFPRCQADS